jgi:hypothetical protein
MTFSERGVAAEIASAADAWLANLRPEDRKG